jgi:CheY-like chemotaxis protein
MEKISQLARSSDNFRIIIAGDGVSGARSPCGVGSSAGHVTQIGTSGPGGRATMVERGNGDVGNAPTVLLLDDNAIQAATRQAILRRAGYFAIAALNPRRALEQFQRNEFPAVIRAVITDHIMPGMSGSDFVRELRKTHPLLPIMVISGMEEAQVEYAGLNVEFLVKPVPPELLLARLRSLLVEDALGAA